MAKRTRLEIVDQRAYLVERLGSRALSDLPRGTIVIIPSLSFPVSELRKIVGIQHYEERLLFMTLLLRNPELHMVYVTSTPIEETVVEYYLSFLPDAREARGRLHMVTIDDASAEALSVKLLGRQPTLDEIRSHISDDAIGLSFNVTEAEWQVMEELDVVLYGPHPDLVWLGSKSGSRHVARKAGVPVLPGAEDLMSVEEVEVALQNLSPGTAVVKLNNGFSGQGNAIVSLAESGARVENSNTVFCADEESWPSFGQKIAAQGAVVEELLRAPRLASPSVQMRIGADGFVEVVSTHDQILGGPDDQVYLGCRFPANGAYRQQIQQYARAMARVLADKGVVGSFGVDFVVVPEAERPRVYMSEINLRLGGTSHPFYMARFATGGLYDETTGRLIADGSAKYYVATDNLKSDGYRGLRPEQLVAALRDAGLAFDRRTKTGVTLHLLGALTDHGKLGCVAIADSREEAAATYAEFESLLDAVGAR